ncbi:MAG: hypothetical protein ACK5NC_05065 [Vibrio sp.]
MDFKKLLLVTSIAATLAACGGGSSGSDDDNDSPEATSMDVVAIDGYLQNADIWLDVNGNQQHDQGEPLLKTDDEGEATLDTTGIDNPEQYSVMVQAIAGETIDTDNLGTHISKDFVLIAPPSSADEVAVTPLTTLVHMKYLEKLNGGSDPTQALAEAKTETASELGVDESSLLGDFKDSGDQAAAYAATYIVYKDILPETPKDMPSTPDELSQFNTDKAAVVSDLNEIITTAKKNGTLDDLKIDLTKDADGDGVPDAIDAYPHDRNRSNTNDYTLNYDTFYNGHQLVPSPGNVYSGELDVADGIYKGVTDREFVWFYTPYPQELEDENYLLSAIADYHFELNEGFSGIPFTNIYVTPKNEEAYTRISQSPAVTEVTGDPVRDTNWNKENPAQDTYVITIKDGKTLNETMKSAGLNKSDFKLLSFHDAVKTVDGDQESIDSNFVLRTGGTEYKASEEFSVDEYSFNPTFIIGDGPEIVIANAVGLTQNPTTGEVTGESYGERIWAYVPVKELGDKNYADYEDVAPLSDYANFDFEYGTYDATGSNAFVNIYVVSDKVIPDNKGNAIQNSNGIQFKQISWIPEYAGEKATGKTYYSIDMRLDINNEFGNLKDRMDSIGLDIKDFKLIAFVDGGKDGDFAGKGNFIYKNGNKQATTKKLSLTKFEY